MGNLDIAVSYMEAIASDDHHGYDQASRTRGTDFDCSSLVSKAYNYAGFPIKIGSTTRNLYEQLKHAGFQEIPLSSTRKRGDILLKVGHHVAACVNEKDIVHASVNEKGTVIGGISGDQTGKEICVRPYYIYKGGWDYLLRLSSQKEDGNFPYWCVMSHDGVRFRKEANLQGDSIIRIISRGEGITVGLPSKGIFSPVNVGGVSGYIATQYLQRQ